MPTITQHRPRRLIRELPASLRPATRLARVGSNQLTITELIAIVLNTSDALDLAEEIVCRFTIEDLPQTTLTELQQLYGIGPSRAGQLLAAIELGRRLVNYREDHPQIIIIPFRGKALPMRRIFSCPNSSTSSRNT